jgi:RNA polymerase sigma-70 factor (ECF subfamily)
MSTDPGTLAAAQTGDEGAFERLVAPYLRELRVHCYRMSGSLHEAEDLMQESLLKVWKGLAGFEQRADLRTWLYKVVTHVCLDALDKRGARVLPMELGPAAGPNEPFGAPRLEPIWLEPCPATLYRSGEPSPATHYETRQSVALAFLVAIQVLPAKQRAVLILRDVLGFQAAECATLLDLTVPAINSALQRARETLATREGQWQTAPPTTDHSALLAKYVQAWEHADVNLLVALLLKDATLAMPPLSQWIAGADAICASIQGMVFGPAGPGAFRLVQTEANGAPAFAAYQRDPESGKMRAISLHVLELRRGLIASITAFLDPALFPLFGLAAELA